MLRDDEIINAALEKYAENMSTLPAVYDGSARFDEFVRNRRNARREQAINNSIDARTVNNNRMGLCKKLLIGGALAAIPAAAYAGYRYFNGGKNVQ